MIGERILSPLTGPKIGTQHDLRSSEMCYRMPWLGLVTILLWMASGALGSGQRRAVARRLLT